MTMLSIGWDEYKRLVDTIRTRKPIGVSGWSHWVLKGNIYTIYFSTPDFKYRCKINKKNVSRQDFLEYISPGFQVKGRVK